MDKFLTLKRGVSPLIATILLIAFAVALASVILQWGLNLDIGKSPDVCRNVEIKIRNIDGSEVCYGGIGSNAYVRFIIDNTGPKDINGLAIWIVGDKGTSLFDIDGVLIRKGSLYQKEDKGIPYDFTNYGNIKQIQFIPKIKSGQTTEICPKNFVKAEKIGICA